MSAEAPKRQFGDRRRGGRRGGRRDGEEKGWTPVTKLGRLVKAGKITSVEQIHLHSCQSRNTKSLICYARLER